MPFCPCAKTHNIISDSVSCLCEYKRVKLLLQFPRIRGAARVSYKTRTDNDLVAQLTFEMTFEVVSIGLL
jgi:hypothetical protein